METSMIGSSATAGITSWMEGGATTICPAELATTRWRHLRGTTRCSVGRGWMNYSITGETTCWSAVREAMCTTMRAGTSLAAM